MLVLLAAAGAGALIAGGDEADEADQLVAFSEPPRISSPNSQVYVNLTAEERKIVAGGQIVMGRAYNGQFIGPTLVMNPGDTLNLNLQNSLNDSTNMHYHGFHVSPKPPSDQVVNLTIPPGRSYPYRVNIPSFHDQGTFWYHSHNHHDSEGQVFGGMSGVTLIGRPAVPPEVQPAADRVLALKDFQVRNGEIPKEGIDSDAPTIRTVNGLVNPQIVSTPGAIELWRLANISADIFYDVELEGNPFYVIGEDGNAPGKMWLASHLVLPPGKRYDVLAQFGPPGTYALKTLRYSTGPGGDEYPEARLATLTVAGNPVKGQKSLAKQALGASGLPNPTLPPKEKVLTENEQTGEFMINGKTFDENRVDDYVPLNAVQDWTFYNKTDEQHPIHIHQDDFWVVARNGEPLTPKGQQDTMIVKPGEKLTARIPFYDFSGKFVYHCHILNHEDHGMMAVVEVLEPGEKKAQPARQASRSHSGHSHSGHSHLTDHRP